MKKRKRNIIFAALVSLLIILVASVGIIYGAYNVMIDYNYDFVAHADTLSINTSGETVTIQKGGATELKATKSDIVLISEDSYGDVELKNVATLSKHSAIKYITFTANDTLFRKSVFQGVPLSSVSDQDTFTASCDVVGMVSAISEAIYYNASLGGNVTVKYDNIFIASQLEFELMNFHSQYNNVFELWNNYQNKQISSRTAYLLTDIYITQDYTVNVPCSINLLTSKLIIGKDEADIEYDASLTLAHSYPGIYYISAISGGITVNTVNFKGGITLNDGEEKFLISTPKSLYRIDSDLSDFVEQTEYSGDYTELLLSDALAFAKGQLPDKIHSSVILSQNYQTYGIKYSYYVISGEGATGELAKFNGKVSASFQSGNSQGLRREDATRSYWIRIYATPKNGASVYVDKEIKVVGSSAAAALQNILDNIAETYYKNIANNKLNLDIDLLDIIRYEYDAGGFREDITISIYESEFPENDMLNEDGQLAEEAVMNDYTAIKLILADDDATRASRIFTVGLNSSGKVTWKGTGSGEKALKYLVINKGIATLSNKFFIKLSSQTLAASASTTKEYDLTVSTRQEVLYYLKSVLTSFTTNKIYNVLNLKNDAQNKGLYFGTEKLISSFLGLNNITNQLVFRQPLDENDPLSLIVERPLDAQEISDVFVYDLANQTYMVKSIKVSVKYIYLKYTFVFEDSQETIYLPVIKSLAEDGGENQEFESSNPFDELFMSSGTVWINGGVFTVSETSEQHFAYIEIVTIDGLEYNTLNPNDPMRKMCTIDVSKNEATGPGDRYDDVLYTDHDEFREGLKYPPFFSGVDGLNTTYYKTLAFVTDRNYVPEYNVSVRVRCWYFNSATPDFVLTQDYVVIVPGIFKCYDASEGEPAPAPDATPSAFLDRKFYNLTLDLFLINYPELYESYVSIFTNEDGVEERFLLSDSAYAAVNLDYSSLTSPGMGVDIEGIQRLDNVVNIILDNIAISNARAFSEMAGSALEYLSLRDCKMTDSVLYGPGATQSYLYNLHFKEIDLSYNSLTYTDKLLSRTVVYLDLSNQMLGNQRCLTDISGLYNLSNLRTLDVSSNAILRFEVFRVLSTLREAYIYDNIVGLSDSELYGTDGRINIPHYVWAIKNFSTEIYANQSDLDGFIKIDRTLDTADRYSNQAGALSDNALAGSANFSEGGNISAEQEEGCIVLNAFATQTNIYTKNAVWLLMYELFNLKVTSPGEGVWEGEEGVDGYYKYLFYNPYGNASIGTLSQSQIAFLSDDGATTQIVGTANLGINNSISFSGAALDSGKTYSYIVTVCDQYGNIIAFREFLVKIVSLS